MWGGSRFYRSDHVDGYRSGMTFLLGHNAERLTKYSFGNVGTDTGAQPTSRGLEAYFIGTIFLVVVTLYLGALSRTALTM